MKHPSQQNLDSPDFRVMVVIADNVGAQQGKFYVQDMESKYMVYTGFSLDDAKLAIRLYT